MLHTLTFKKGVYTLCFLVTLCVAAPGKGQAPETPAPSGQRQLQQRIDFGNTYIMGQSIKSGAVYLLHRKQSHIESMLKTRSDYRKEIQEDYALEGTKIVKEIPNPSDKKDTLSAISGRNFDSTE